MIAYKYCLLLLSVLALQVKSIISISEPKSSPVTHAIEIQSAEQLDSLLKDTQGRLLVMNFKMQRCSWCEKLRDVWSKLVSDMSQQYPEALIFVTIDGTEHQDIAKKYGVRSYPTLICKDLTTEDKRAY